MNTVQRVAITLGLLLVVFVGCTLTGKTVQNFPGPTTPPGSIERDPTPAIVTLIPPTLTYQSTQNTIQLNITVRDTFVWNEIGLCVTPCTEVSNWRKIGLFPGQSVQSGFLDGRQRVSAMITLHRDNLSQGNNFLAFYSCNGIGLCHGDKWVSVPFTVQLVSPTCTDGEKDGDETDIDCGGSCPKCDPGKLCGGGNDCISGVCIQGRCARPTCTDGVKNQDETDVDCGGACVAQGKACNVSKRCNVDTDCANGQCDAPTKQCVARCTSNSDCGYLLCSNACIQVANLPPPPTALLCSPSSLPAGNFCVCQADTSKCVAAKANAFTIQIKNFFFGPNNLTVVNGTKVTWLNLGAAEHTTTSDLGQPESFNSGSILPNAKFDYIFTKNGTTQYECTNHRFVMPANITTIDIKGTCSDNIKYGSETDIDCGGACVAESKKCSDTKKCLVNADCQSNQCENNVCKAVPSCQNGMKDGQETDVDCGGPTCPKCGDNKDCTADTDCTGQKCKQNKCISLSDLTVKDIAFLQTSGNTLPITIKIQNSGTAVAMQPVAIAYTVTFPDSPGKAPQSGTLTVTGDIPISTVATVDQTITVALDQALQVNVEATVDPANQKEELDETNNRKTTSTTIGLSDPGLPGRQDSGAAPTITITSPAEGATVTTATPQIQFTVTNAADKKIKVFIDNTAQTSLLAPTESSYTTSTLNNAGHTVKLEIVNADGSPLAAPIIMTRSFTVNTAADKCTGISCTGSTPKCNPVDGTCVQCLNNPDCGDGNPQRSPSGVITTGLEAWYKFDETTGEAIDSIGGNNNCFPTGGVDRANGIAQFNGASAYLGSCAQTNLVALTGQPNTVEMWVKMNTLSTNVAFLADAGNSNGVTFQHYSGFFFSPTQGLNYGGNYGTQQTVSQSNTNGWDTTKWHHIVFVSDGATYNLYLDGQRVANSGIQTAYSLISGGRLTIAARDMGGGVTVDYFNGAIAEARMYNRALTQNEIVTNYNAEKPVTCDTATKKCVSI